MKTNILLPTDFSENAWSAVVYAIKLYTNEKCTFHFLHSTNFKTTARTYITSHYIKELKDEALQDLLDLKKMARVSDANENHNFEIIISDKDLASVINETLLKLDINLIVMGTKGVTSKIEAFFGSNTISIIKKMKRCPVLIVPEEFDFIEPAQIAFPTDFHRFYGEEILPLKRLAKLYNSKIRILHINEADKLTNIQEYNLEMLKTYLKNYACSFHWMPDYAKKTQEINDFIEELDINVLVMINYKHSLIESIIKEPIIKKIGFKPIVPVLVIPCSI